MKLKQFYLSTPLIRQLEYMAKLRDVSEAEIVRKALDSFFRDEEILHGSPLSEDSYEQRTDD